MAETFSGLKQRKETLLLESNLNRLVLQLEVENVKRATARGREIATRVQSYGSWILPVLSGLGIIAGTKLGKKSTGPSWIKLAIGAVPLIAQLLKLRKSPQPTESNVDYSV